MKRWDSIGQYVIIFGYAFFSEALGFGINDNFTAWFIGLMGLFAFGCLNYLEGEAN